MITFDTCSNAPRQAGNIPNDSISKTTSSLAFTTDSPSAIDVLVESFQKEAISCQFRENTRQIALLESEKTSATKRAAMLADGLTAIGGWWTEIADELLILSAHFGLPINLNEVLHMQDCARPPFFSTLLSVENEEPFENQLNAMYTQAQQIVATFIRHLASIKVPPNESLSSTALCDKLSDELRSRYAEMRRQLIDMERLCLTQKKQVETQETNIEEKSEKIRQLEKTVDRLQCRTWTSVFLRPPPQSSSLINNTSTFFTPGTPSCHPSHLSSPLIAVDNFSKESPSSPAQQNSRKSQVDCKTLSNNPVDSSIECPDKLIVGMTSSSETEQNSSDPQSTECSRLLEIRALVEELTETKNERDNLRLQTQVLPESILNSHPLVISLRNEISVLANENLHWRQKSEELCQLQMQMREEYAQWLQNHKDNIAARETQFETEQRKVHDEIFRLRKQRDEHSAVRETLQIERNAKLKHTESLHNHIKLKDSRISILESNLERALNKLKKLGTASSMDESLHLADEFQKDVADKKKNGNSTSSVTVVERQEVDPLEEARQQVELLMAEVNAVSEGYAKLDQSITRDIVIIKEKEDYITKLIADKTKLDSKNLFLRKQCDQLKQEGDLCRKSLETCREVQRLAEEKERSAITHMIMLEKELKWARESIGCHRDRAIDLGHQFISIQHQAEAAEERHRVASIMLRDRTAEVEQLRYEKNRFIEEAQTISRALNSEIVDKNGDNMQLLESYRQILTCSTCKTRLKNTVLLRCMHTFCRHCVNDRLESRQRKCPTCGDSFGQNDVRTIYI